MRQKRILHFSVNVLFWFFPSKTLCKNASFRLKTQMIIRFCSNLNRISLFLKSRFCRVCTASYKVGENSATNQTFLKKANAYCISFKKHTYSKRMGENSAMQISTRHACLLTYLLKIIKPTWFFFKLKFQFWELLLTFLLKTNFPEF